MKSHDLMNLYLQEVARDGKLHLIDQIAHEDMVDEANQAFGGPPGRAGLVAHVKGFRKHMHEAAIEIHKVVGDEHEVMAWWSFNAIHAGPWLGIEPTNERISGTVFSFFALRDQRIQRYRLWLQADFDPPVIFDSAEALARLQKTGD